jgi:hypothetical protein
MISELHSMAIRTRGFFDRGGGKDLEKWLCGMGGIEKKKASEFFFFNKNGYEIRLKSVAMPLVQITKCPVFLWDFYLDYKLL